MSSSANPWYAYFFNYFFKYIDTWISHYESTIFIDDASESILSLLAKVTEFLQTVFLGTIIRDMKMLLHRYSKHCSRSLISSV